MNTSTQSLQNNILKKANNIFKKNGTNSNSNPRKINMKLIITSLLIIILLGIVIYLILSAVKYNKTECFKKKSFVQYVFDFSNKDVCLIEEAPLPVKPVPPPPKTNAIENIIQKIENQKEVFHIGNQDYTYEQSKCKCESYGAKLATKAQLTDAYNKGAHWCSYGWTDGQSAYYPVQQCEWDKMDEINQRLPENERTYCGIPGINGGYFPNPELKFGVNCYGVKPKGEVHQAKAPYCPPMNFCKLESNFQSSHKLDTDEITPFNSEQWSMDL